MNEQLTDADTYTHLSGALDKFLNLEPLVNSIQGVLNGYQPAAYILAFIVLVVGMMREFLYAEPRRFLHSVLRAVLLVATIGLASSLIEWCDQAAQALARLPAPQEVNLGDRSYSINPGQAPTVTQLEQVLQAKVQGSVSKKGNVGNQRENAAKTPQFSANPFDFGKDLGIVWSYLAGFTQNLVWEILFAIYLLCLLLCKVIILLMQFVQRVVVIGFKLYTPIAVAEYAHRSLQGKAISFFLTFVGLLAWPVGWSLVNTVTLGVFKSLPTPQNQNFATLMIAIVLAVPVLLWVLIGHVLAPIFVQKAIVRGGAAIQGFVGTIFSAVGAGSAAIYGGGIAASANWLRNSKQNGSQGLADLRSRDSSANESVEKLVLKPFDGQNINQEGGSERSGTPFVRSPKEQDRAKGEQSALGAAMMDSGAAMMNRFGSVARFIGHAVIEGSGEGSGLEYRALAAFAPLGANARPSANQTNRSSLQARRYLDER